MNRPLVFAVSLLCPALALAACGGGGDDGPVTPEGPHYQYVVSKALIPIDNNTARDYGLDLGSPKSDKPDGTVDNQLGMVLGTLHNMGFDIQTTVDTAVAKGSIILLIDLQTKDFTNTTAAGLKVDLGANPMPAPCSSTTDTTCGNHLKGTGMFSIAPGSPDDAAVAGKIVNGTFNGGPGNLTLQIALGGTMPLTLNLLSARAKASSITGTTIDSLQLGGALTQNDLNTQVIPAIQAQLGPIITRDCPYAKATTTPACACDACQAGPGVTDAAKIAACVAHDADSAACAADTANGCAVLGQGTGKTILGLFDGDLMGTTKDCTVSVAEIMGNALIQSLLSPDVCSMATCTAPDSLSLGIKVSTVGATFM